MCGLCKIRQVSLDATVESKTRHHHPRIIIITSTVFFPGRVLRSGKFARINKGKSNGRDFIADPR
jgi:hypothetical protein